MVADRRCTFLPSIYVTNSTYSRCRQYQNVSYKSTHLTLGHKNSKTTPRWSPAVRSVRFLRVFTQWLSSLPGILFSVWCFIALCGRAAAAADRQHPSLEKLARRNGLLVDLSDRPESPLFRPMERRDSTSYAPIQASTVTLLSTGHPTTITTAEPNASPTILPQVFDSNIGNNFTSTTCPTFFVKLIANSDFQECYPLSLLLTVRHCQIIPNEKLLTSGTAI